VAEVDATCSNGTTASNEGRRTNEIREERPDWELFRDGCPGGVAAQVGARADRVLACAFDGNTLLSRAGIVGAGRALASARSGSGRYFVLETASLSMLGSEHNLSEPAIRLWGDTRHVGE
jgi:probable phosphoglycerate mutase